MCMSCGNDSENNGGRKFGKKKIAILSMTGVGVAGGTYLAATVNPAIGASIPALLTFAACPAMCAAMGATMWVSKRFSKRKNLTRVQEPVVNSKQEVAVAKTESEQQITYPKKLRKNKAHAQDTSAITD
jgi:hypothetical protein